MVEEGQGKGPSDSPQGDGYPGTGGGDWLGPLGFSGEEKQEQRRTVEPARILGVGVGLQ